MKSLPEHLQRVLSDTDMHGTIPDNTEKGVYCADESRLVFFRNRAFERIAGFTEEDRDRQALSWPPLHHKDETGKGLCKVFCPFAATMFDGKTRHHPVTVLCKDGVPRPMTVNAYPLYESEAVGKASMKDILYDVALSLKEYCGKSALVGCLMSYV